MQITIDTDTQRLTVDDQGSRRELALYSAEAFSVLSSQWVRVGWSLARDQQVPAWARGQGVLMLAVMATYLSSAVFHDVTLLPQQEWLLFLFAGLTLNLRLGSQFARQEVAEKGTVEYLAPQRISAAAGPAIAQ